MKMHKTDSNIHHVCICQDDRDCAALFHRENWVSIKVRVLGTYQVSGLKDVCPLQCTFTKMVKRPLSICSHSTITRPTGGRIRRSWRSFTSSRARYGAVMKACVDSVEISYIAHFRVTRLEGSNYARYPLLLLFRSSWQKM